ncbi:MAG TPA: redoxin domain-containing protein [Planctomycetaceae bacterium]|nr:redoxin domain-containing protein [Planctomycetaceae bacterium]
MMATRISLSLVFACAAVSAARAENPGSVSSQYRSLVPHRVLALLHGPEIHTELKLTDRQVEQLETLFSEIDGTWFPARILPPDEQFPILDQLEQRVHDWMAEHATPAQRARLRQLELQGQSTRMLLRDDLAKELKLSERQQRELVELAKTTDAAQFALRQAVMRNESSHNLQNEATKAIKAEQDAVTEVLQPSQRRQLARILGTTFDITKLKRTYPLAPEFVPVEQWINSEPLTLKELRGKVVVVHFYAFQCHNCHANFEIYRRWHEQLKDKGVVVIGIQTPETSRERDPAAVRSAAAERKLEFPILIDQKSENWKAWGNTMWPTVYVVDKNGYLRHWWQGELNWKGATGDKTIEQTINTALAEPHGQ